MSERQEVAGRTKALADERFLLCVGREVDRARAKFPNGDDMALAATEEAGEAIKALLDFKYGNGSTADIYKECVQAAAMFLRLATEGDKGTGYPGYTFADFVAFPL